MSQQLYTMTQEDYDAMVNRMTSARNTPLIMLQVGMPRSAQEVANDCWEELGKKMGFKYMTVKPGPTKLTFYAEPTQ